LCRWRADDDGLAAQGWVIALFDGRVEGVHIEMENDSVHVLNQLPAKEE
jgi:hypothetical protein